MRPMTSPVSCMSDVLAAVGPARREVVEPERLVPVKPEVQAGLGHPTYDARAQRTYTEELRREPIPDKYAGAHAC